ncbi:MAG: class I SAM-dependent methyltransferase [Candidatus Poribacteria bacterium]|nr:class I SAM-dependent methyltransferase [Candidatus Poribacteria bacterium]
MKLNTQTYIDIIEWDVANWQRALTYWDREISAAFPRCKALEIGGQNGGLSLYLALRGCDVVCSDVRPPTLKAREIMARYKVGARVTYASVDVTDIPFPADAFDIVAFKSVLGSVGIHRGEKGQRRAIDEIHRVLKPDGFLLFAENLKASAIHTFFRQRFVEWGHAWRYPTVQEMKTLTAQFSAFHYETYGYFSCFGRSEWQKRALSTLDRLAAPFLSERSKYIIYGYAIK